MTIPDSILRAINAMLEPYGERFIPGGETEATRGCLTPADAAKFLGCSRTFLYKLTSEGALQSIKLNKGARNGKVVYAISDLQAYINRQRS
jgi:excisionase family DNA binding protein